jgi:hypothetical protein
MSVRARRKQVQMRKLNVRTFVCVYSIGVLIPLRAKMKQLEERMIKVNKGMNFLPSRADFLSRSSRYRVSRALKAMSRISERIAKVER